MSSPSSRRPSRRRLALLGAVGLLWLATLAGVWRTEVLRDRPSEDVQALSHFVFGHRLELAPGAADPTTVVNECLANPLERLARATMQR